MNSEILPFALDFSEADWKNWCSSQNAPAYLGKQLLSWLFHRQETSPANFSNIAMGIRQKLAEAFRWELPQIDSILSSQEDSSEKILLRTHDNRLFEMVLMPEERRTTLCVSCQVGCRMGCTFCQTGKMGLTRNLSRGEILSQLVIANRRLKERGFADRSVTNIVFMGMGEPLDNYDEVVAACKTMLDPTYFGLSKHKVTVSTSGLVPEIKRLGEDLPVCLAISLHSANEEVRSKMMPINRRYSLQELKETLVNYPVQTRHGITFEYVMIQGVNDSILDAKKLVKFLHGMKAKVNLIPMNPHPGNPQQSSTPEQIAAFQKHLTDRSIPAPVRYSRGRDVSGACGQLANKRQDELHLRPAELRQIRRTERV